MSTVFEELTEKVSEIVDNAVSVYPITEENRDIILSIQGEHKLIVMAAASIISGDYENANRLIDSVTYIHMGKMLEDSCKKLVDSIDAGNVIK